MWIWTTLSLGHHAHDNESEREVTRCARISLCSCGRVNHTLHLLRDVMRRTSWEHVKNEVSVLPGHLARDLLLRVRAVTLVSCAPPSDSHFARWVTDTRQDMRKMCPCACCSDGQVASIFPNTLEWGFVQEVSLSASNVSTLPARVRRRHCVCINSFLFVAFQSKCGTHVADVETRPEARPSKPSENHSGDVVPPVRTPKHTTHHQLAPPTVVRLLHSPHLVCCSSGRPRPDCLCAAHAETQLPVLVSVLASRFFSA